MKLSSQNSVPNGITPGLSMNEASPIVLAKVIYTWLAHTNYRRVALKLTCSLLYIIANTKRF